MFEVFSHVHDVIVAYSATSSSNSGSSSLWHY